jgi:hypothetical protein
LKIKGKYAKNMYCATSFIANVIDMFRFHDALEPGFHSAVLSLLEGKDRIAEGQ